MAEFDFEAFRRLVLEKFSDLGEEFRHLRAQVHATREQVKAIDAKVDSLAHRTDRLHADLAALAGSVGSLVALAGRHSADILEVRRRIDDIERQRREGE